MQGLTHEMKAATMERKSAQEFPVEDVLPVMLR